MTTPGDPAEAIPRTVLDEVLASDAAAKSTGIRHVAIFSLLAIAMSATVALFVPKPSDLLIMGVPTIATVLMLLVFTREGYTKVGWAGLGIHRSGAKFWPVAILGPLLVGMFAVAATVVIGQASLTWPEEVRHGDGLRALGIWLAFSLLLALGEEIGWRGYLVPRLLPLGQIRALLISGLIWATWHVPFILWFGYHSDGNIVLVLPLFYGTIVAAGFFFGYMRIYSDSVWPATIGHGTHNFAWGMLAMFTVSSHPVVVEEYLGGDNGVFILAGTIVLLVWAHR